MDARYQDGDVASAVWRSWHQINWSGAHQSVARLQTRIAKAICNGVTRPCWHCACLSAFAFGLLEPDAGKLARPVLRGGGDREVISLPDLRRRFDPVHPLHLFTLHLEFLAPLTG